MADTAGGADANRAANPSPLRINNIPLNPPAAQNGTNNAINNRQRNNINPLIDVRDRLFHALFFKTALAYATIFPRPIRRAFELFILLKALIAFFTLVYIHATFLKFPATCLEHVKSEWPRDGVLRVEILPNRQTDDGQGQLKSAERALLQAIGKNRHSQTTTSGDAVNVKQPSQNVWAKCAIRDPNKCYNYHYTGRFDEFLYNQSLELDQNYEFEIHQEAVKKRTRRDIDASANENQYIVEYSLEYGHLRLSAATRKKLKIPVLTVVLDPDEDKCFGDSISRYLLREFLGYDDLLMASVRVVAEQEDNKGYLRNVITGEHYRFVSMWWAPWSYYPAAFCVMILFTVSISMLLRYSHHQIFVFIVDLLQMLEFNVSARFPFAPLLTVILALVGGNIVLLFFYLYHFSFYAYHYRFNGQYSSLALISSWLLIQHSMFYFFHHYELPVIIQQAHLQQVLLHSRQQNAAQQQAANGRGPAGNGGANGGNGGNNLPPTQRPRGRNNNNLRELIRPLMERRGDFIVTTLRRLMYGMGWMAPVPMRVVNIGNLRRINLDSIQINPSNYVTPTSQSTAPASTTGQSNNANTTGTADGSATTADRISSNDERNEIIPGENSPTANIQAESQNEVSNGNGTAEGNAHQDKSMVKDENDSSVIRPGVVGQDKIPEDIEIGISRGKQDQTIRAPTETEQLGTESSDHLGDEKTTSANFAVETEPTNIADIIPSPDDTSKDQQNSFVDVDSRASGDGNNMDTIGYVANSVDNTLKITFDKFPHNSQLQSFKSNLGSSSRSFSGPSGDAKDNSEVEQSHFPNLHQLGRRAEINRPHSPTQSTTAAMNPTTQNRVELENDDGHT